MAKVDKVERSVNTLGSKVKEQGEYIKWLEKKILKIYQTIKLALKILGISAIAISIMMDKIIEKAQSVIKIGRNIGFGEISFAIAILGIILLGIGLNRKKVDKYSNR